MNPIRPRKSSYLRDPRRLADLIAAGQVLGTYKFSSRPAERWLKRLGRRPVSADTWLQIFEAHPEFFTKDDLSLVSLVRRRNKERNYDTHIGQVVPRDVALVLKAADPEASATRLSRAPLSSDEISKLIDIAIALHEREIKHQQERHWWYNAIIAAAGVVVSLLSRT